MGLGKILMLGATVLSVVHAHGVLACEMRPKARPATEALRKPAKIADGERRANRVPSSYTPIFSRRLILQ